MTTRSDLLAALGNRNVQAFLTLIRTGLGTDHGDGYRTTAGLDLIDDLFWHPGCCVVLMPDQQRYTVSSEAGAYRIMHRVWTELADRYGLDDFHPPSQDEAAVALIAMHGALPDVIAGRLETAAEKCAVEWACLPGGDKDVCGGASMSLEHAINIYHRRGGRLESEALPAEFNRHRSPSTRYIVIGAVAIGLLIWAVNSRSASLIATLCIAP